MLIWTGSVTLEVPGVTNAARQVRELTREISGYVESTSYSGGRNDYYKTAPSVTMTLRIPSEKLDSAIGGLERIGEVKSKSISSTDVTEKYVDTQARLETKKQLRDRLQQLLEKAEDVKDVLAIPAGFVARIVSPLRQQ